MSVSVNEAPEVPYEAELQAWRRAKDEVLTAEDGWLSLVGLFWLDEGENTVGSDPTSGVPLPTSSVPERLGVLTLHEGTVQLDVTASEIVTVDEVAVTRALLRPDTAPDGPAVVRIGTVLFYVLQRGDRIGIRAKDSSNPARTTFQGRRWFAINTALRVPATFQRYESVRWIEMMTSAGIVESLKNIGRVDFEIEGQSMYLEALDGDAELWFVFRDATSGKLTYGGGRFLYAPLDADGRHLTLDFNRAYFPPCAFTPYAACPLPPPDNHLKLAIEAGERR